MVGGRVDVLDGQRFPNSAQSAEVNWAPRSEVRLVGTPNLAIQPLIRASAHVVAEMSFTGIASGHLDHLSTIVKMYAWPSDCGNGPTRSTWRCPKRLSGALNLSNGDLMCLPTLLDWQSAHSRHHVRTSLLRLCQTKRSDTTRVVGTGPRLSLIHI